MEDFMKGSTPEYPKAMEPVLEGFRRAYEKGVAEKEERKKMVVQAGWVYVNLGERGWEDRWWKKSIGYAELCVA
jgi:hypothetical protein